MKRTADDRPSLALWERAEAGEEQLGLGQRMRLANQLASLPQEMVHRIAMTKPTFAGYRAVYHMAGLRPYVNDEVLDEYTLYEEQPSSFGTMQYAYYVLPTESIKIMLQNITVYDSTYFKTIVIENYKYAEPRPILLTVMRKVKDTEFHDTGSSDMEKYYFLDYSVSTVPYEIIKKNGQIIRTNVQPVEEWEPQMQFMDQMMKKYLP